MTGPVFVIRPGLANPRMSMFVDLFDPEDFTNHRLHVRLFIFRQIFEPLTGQRNESNAGADTNCVSVSILGMPTHARVTRSRV